VGRGEGVRDAKFILKSCDWKISSVSRPGKLGRGGGGRGRASLDYRTRVLRRRIPRSGLVHWGNDAGTAGSKNSRQRTGEEFRGFAGPAVPRGTGVPPSCGRDGICVLSVKNRGQRNRRQRSPAGVSVPGGRGSRRLRARLWLARGRRLCRDLRARRRTRRAYLRFG
jgi:hypothetical protein